MRTCDIETLGELTARSVADVAWFWDAVVHDLDIEFSTPGVLSNPASPNPCTFA